GGNWLALAYQWRGELSMSGNVSYLPAFPLLLASLLSIFSPLAALVTAAIVSKWLLTLATYWCLRELGRLPAALTAVLLGLAAYQLEAYAWGAYPQLLATAAGLVATYLAVRFVREGVRADLAWSLAAAAVIFATHKLVAALLVVALPASLLASTGVRGVSRARVRLLLVISGPAVLGIFSALQWMREAQAGARPVINPLDLGLSVALQATLREAFVPWVIVAAAAALALARRSSWRWGFDTATSIGLGWAMAGSGFFLASGEQRALLLAQLGLVMAAAANFSRWRVEAAARSPAPSAALAIAGLSMLGSISVTGLASFSDATDWYRVVDEEDLKALRDLRQFSQPGDVVVASRGRNGNQVGWWVQGYVRRPTYSAVDARFLTFPEEQAQAKLAERLFSGELGESQTMSLLEEIEARFIVVDRRGPDGDWLPHSKELDLRKVYDSQSLVILEVP
ncbi:MAG: hypothetical protein M3N51_00475, partial [Actinomycetota bacterium]|nr:hypothetical protein [Actinomycetota bacterium]